MKISKMTGLVLSGVLVLAPLLVYAATPCPMDEKGHEGKGRWEQKGSDLKKMYKDLNLTEDQQKALEANKSKNKEETKALFQSMKDKMTALKQEVEKEPLDMNKVNQIQSELKTIQAQMSDQRLESILAVRKILSGEQFKKFMDKMEEHGKMGPGKHGIHGKKQENKE
ncbi:MAG: periplasmic heavy metal sensor [Candidatus Omnitrophica bacterium]|nr:periplasmic heavy metal sensor [Candidatus Omnitrophota bacterium]